MKRFGVAATQGKGADILGIDAASGQKILASARYTGYGPPAGMGRVQKAELRRYSGVPFLPFGKVNLEAIESWEIPSRAGKGNPHFLVDRPNIPVHPCASSIRRANALKGCIERVAIARPSRRIILTTDSKEIGPAGRLNKSPLNVR